MISVIVPVYNVEPYLRKCMDSILGQTDPELEILVIDDGSTDQSGEICDEYAKADSRIRVFHTENRGLSEARNLGLDEAKGDYFGFVDSDDWIEPDMYEILLKTAVETGADVVECSVYLEYPDRTEEVNRQDRKMTGMQAVAALLHNDLSDGVWNKLYRRKCFDRIRFPKDRIFEEIATTYRVFSEADIVCSVAKPEYHYLQRPNGLSKETNMKNLVDYHYSQRERFEALQDRVDEETRHEMLRRCARSLSRIWVHYEDFPLTERLRYRDDIEEMNVFSKQHLPLFGDSSWEIRIRVGTFFSHFQNGLSFRAAGLLNRMDHALSGNATQEDNKQG